MRAGNFVEGEINSGANERSSRHLILRLGLIRKFFQKTLNKRVARAESGRLSFAKFLVPPNSFGGLSHLYFNHLRSPRFETVILSRTLGSRIWRRHALRPHRGFGKAREWFSVEACREPLFPPCATSRRAFGGRNLKVPHGQRFSFLG